MQKVIISDTSCLILLQNIGELDLLFKLFGTVITTPEVSSEFGQQLPDWIDIKQPKDKKYQSLIEVSVDRGEASAIALAIEYENSLLIIDDLKGRKLPQKLGLEITGTVGVIVDAKLSGVIPSLNELLVKIENTDFRISENLKKIILRKAIKIIPQKIPSAKPAGFKYYSIKINSRKKEQQLFAGGDQ